MIFAALLAGAAAHASEVLPGPYAADVVRVIDGDTFVARVRIWLGHDVVTHVRLLGIDAPELKGACPAEAEAARARLARLLASGPVSLSRIKHDKYAGRIGATVTLPDGSDAARAMLAAHHARAWAGRKVGC